MTKNVRNFLLASMAIGLMMVGPARAADDATVKALQAQMQALQKQLNELQAQQKATAKAQAEAAAKPAASAESKKEILPGVKVKVGGFIAADTVYRSKNQSNDIGSTFNSNSTNTTSIPFYNAPNYHQSEFRGSARNTRLSLLTEGEVDKDMKLTAYIESDFAGAGNTSNSVATNSYVPRLRQAFAQVDRNDWGLHFTAGQTWSLLTMSTKANMDPRAVSVPNVMDSGVVPGFTYARLPQARIVKDLFDNKVGVALSVENPQISLGQTFVPTGVQVQNASGSTLNPGTNFSTDQAPDVVAKVGFDPGWGHFEVFGVTRFFHNNLNGTTASGPFHNNIVVGGGGGAGMILPVIDKKLDFRAQFMMGQGIGRYGAAGLPDVAFDSLGGVHPLFQYTTLAGLVAKPTPTWELFLYGGLESIERENQEDATTTNRYGYGSYTASNNANCYVANSSSCFAQTSSIWQVTPGAWKDLYKGDYGNLKVGAQYSFTRRNSFTDSNGVNPHAYTHMVFTAFRYSPF